MKPSYDQSTCLVTIALVVSVALAGCGTTVTNEQTVTRPMAQRAPTGFTLEDVRSFSRFPLYWVGRSFERLPLTAITRRDDAPRSSERVRADYVAFIYGDCVAVDEAGCPPPLEVQIWPACERSLGDYALTPSGDRLPHRTTTVRGVPAAFFEHGLRLELYTGKITIVIFGLERRQLVRAAAALRGANALASNQAKLPSPARGATAGTLTCA